MDATQLPLKDIHLPPAIGWWPPAPGWWLSAVLLPLTLYLIYRLIKRITRNTSVKIAKQRLRQIKEDRQLDPKQKLSEISILLRRVAISTAARQTCAGLTGQAWLDYLDASIQGAPFSRGVGRWLSDAPYRKSSLTEQDIGELVALCERWLKAQTKRKR